MKERTRYILSLVYGFVPKRNIAFIWAWPDLEDQSRALVPLLATSSHLSKVVIVATNIESVKQEFEEFGDKVEVLTARSPRAFFLFLQARYVFTTHRHLVRKYPEDVIAVNIWHGMPVKRIGLMLDREADMVARHTVVTSEFWAEIMERSLPSTHGPLVTGLPRNDRLLLPPEATRAKLGLAERGDVRKVIAWLPTYRKSIVGELRQDGKTSDSTFGIEEITPEALNAFCCERECFLWIKPHPMAPPMDLGKFSHLASFSDADLIARGVSLYEALGASDLLISDFSSVYVDYLILNRPVIHAFADQQAYAESRGFSVEPLEDYLAGPVVSSAEEFYAALDAFAKGHDADSEKRSRLRSLFFKDVDGNASRRLLDAIGL